MKSKLKIIVPLALVIAGLAYKMVLAKPPKPPVKKVPGTVYVLPKNFVLNLAGDHFVSLGVALVLKKGEEAAPPAKEGEAATPPDGYGVMPQEALVRSIVTDTITDQKPHALESAKGRDRLTTRILHRLQHDTDVPAAQVVLTDVAVQGS